MIISSSSSSAATNAIANNTAENMRLSELFQIAAMLVNNATST